MGHYIGIDVGTGSARAGIFDAGGRLLGTASAPLTIFRPQHGYAQHSSQQVWQSVCAATRGAVNAAGVGGDAIAGIGFDATCSLVVTDLGDAPVTVSPDASPDQDIVMWMDHRAIPDADAINSIGGEPLRHVGGVISPEMQMPKLRWLKREMPESWARAAGFWDLPDWLVHRATGTAARSLCSAVCKWTYLGHRGKEGQGWDDDFLSRIGLGDLAGDGHAAIGNLFLAPGALAGRLTARAAAELGLAPGTPVASGMIDAYAGALGTLGVDGDGGTEARLALIAGTSSCHIAVTRDPHFVPGVWGPYRSVLLPEMWANEGGQSAAGALLDAVVARHGASAALQAEASACGRRVTDLLEDRLAAKGGDTALLTSERHVQPDFHGNRSPLADPWRKGAIVGLTLDAGPEDLALDYLATVQALAYGTRQIIEEMRATGAKVETIVVSGGLARNALFVRENADATGCRVLVPAQAEPVLLGGAIMAAVASGAVPTLEAAMSAMSGAAETVLPRGGAVGAYHAAKYRVFRRMQQDYAEYVALMAAPAASDHERHAE